MGDAFNAEISNVLVVGVDLVALAVSARAAGYQVYAADYFGDVDLRRVCHKCLSIVEQKPGKTCGKIESNLSSEAFLKMVELLLRGNRIDAALLSSGLDDSFDVLERLNDLVPILGNSPDTIRKVRGKTIFFEELKRLRIPHPKTVVVHGFGEARKAAKEIGYPVVLKPSSGFGGVGIREVKNPRELKRVFQEFSPLDEGVLVQERLYGVHASVSFIASRGDVEVLTLNEQLVGLHEAKQREPFGYCGNTVPLNVSKPTAERCKRIVKKLALHFGLKGSNGVDLVISEDGVPHVVEVNPRFQGTLECVEQTLGINLVKTHVEACVHGVLSRFSQQKSSFCTRLVLYAPCRVVAPDLTPLREVRDVPLPGTIIEDGEPLCSVVTKGSSRHASFSRAVKLAGLIYKMLGAA